MLPGCSSRTFLSLFLRKWKTPPFPADGVSSPGHHIPVANSGPGEFHPGRRRSRFDSPRGLC